MQTTGSRMPVIHKPCKTGKSRNTKRESLALCEKLLWIYRYRSEGLNLQDYGDNASQSSHAVTVWWQ